VLQDALGEINDLVVARETYLALAETQPPAWFAVGWIGARLEVLYKGAEEEFRALDDTRPFWK
jgi:CHAD domain-containing protein